jgi:hypothetical protein
MNRSVTTFAWLVASTCWLAGCVTDGAPHAAVTHLSAAQCRDLTALRHNAPPTSERKQSELAALRSAGYDPSRWFDPYYPEDLQAAQRRVDSWYEQECRPASTSSN